MKKTNRNSWIPLLMGLSQVLLTGFVIYWIIGQYGAERENLQKKLFYDFMEAQNEAMDSTLYGYLHPILQDSLFSEDSSYHRGWRRDSTSSIEKVHLSARYSTEEPVDGKFFQVGFGDSDSKPDQEVLLKGVKMIIEMSNDTMNLAGVEGGHFFPEVDSLLLLNLVSGRVNAIEHNDFNLVWYQDSLFNPQQNSNKRIRFQSTLSRPAMIYEVANFEPLILRKISPQILFALLLIILIASAFLLTYRNLRKQVFMNTLRNEFISNVSHELKTPVSTVKVALESLQSYDLKKDAAVSDEYLKMASLEMDRLDLLIQKILDQSLLESQLVVINPQDSDLLVLTKGVIQSQQPRILEMNGSLELITEVEEAKVFMDALYIQGVLINLLDNGIKYGGDPPKIEVGIRKENGRVFLSVKDNGRGIKREYQEKVFERFFRVPTGDTHNVKGYGLGLSFASQVMQQHGGSIKLENSSSSGSLFTICFNEKK